MTTTLREVSSLGAILRGALYGLDAGPSRFTVIDHGNGTQTVIGVSADNVFNNHDGTLTFNGPDLLPSDDGITLSFAT